VPARPRGVGRRSYRFLNWRAEELAEARQAADTAGEVRGLLRVTVPNTLACMGPILLDDR
jgi:hypothetical protein